MQYKGIIFDLDGTLLDSMGMWYGIDRTFLAEYGIEATDDVSETVKNMTLDRSAEYFVERFSLPVTPGQVMQRIEELAEAAYREVLPLKDGAEAFLQEMQRQQMPCVLASVTYPRLLLAALQRLNIRDYFQALLTPADHSQGKHSPALYLEAAALLQAAPQELIVIEDALYAAKTAKQAGFYTIGFRDETARADWPELERICDRVIDSWRELLP